MLPSEISQHYKIISAKMNLARKDAGDDVWFELVSITLGNAEPPIYMHGDSVQAVRRAVLTPPGNRLTAQQLLAYKFILDFVDATLNRVGTGDPFSLHPKGGGSKNRSLLAHVTQPLACTVNPAHSKRDAAVFAKRCIEDLIEREWLVSLPTAKSGPQKSWSRAAVNWEETPWAASKGTPPSYDQA